MVSLFLYKNATVFYIGKERGKTMKEKMTAREWLPLIGMTVAAFIFNTSEFMPIGLLTDIAQNYHIIGTCRTVDHSLCLGGHAAFSAADAAGLQDSI